jgi:hypothetical protein
VLDRRDVLECHHVACESARLIREDIFNLPKLLIDIGALGTHLEILALIIHQDIIVHETTLPKFDDL